MFTRCLICTDFSDGLQRLVHFVPQLAKSGLTHICFVHSVPLWEEGEIPRVDQEKIAAAQEKLKVATQQVPEGVTVKVVVLSGRLEDTIPDLLEAEQIEVVLVGASVQNILQERLFGSSSQALARMTIQPLLLLRPQLISTYTREELSLRCEHLWRYLLIPYNGGPSAKYLIERLKTHIQKCPDSICKHCLICWVIDKGGRPELLDYKLKEAEQKLAQVKQELTSLGLTVKTELLQGNPLQELLKTSIEHDISAIALASAKQNLLLDWTVPDLTQEMLHRSWFPIMLFTPKK